MFKRRKKKGSIHKLQDQHWFVVFCDSDEIGWPFTMFTRPNFMHCFCIADTKEGAIMMNYIKYHCEVRMFYGIPASRVAFEFVNGGGKVLQVRTGKKNGFILRGSIYCVTLVKSFLGLRGCFAVSPFGLYEWLKRSNLEIIDLNEITEQCMGGGKKDSGNASLMAAQQAQLDQANQQAATLLAQTNASQDALRRKQAGFASLIGTQGGELGAPISLMGNKTAAAN